MMASWSDWLNARIPAVAFKYIFAFYQKRERERAREGVARRIDREISRKRYRSLSILRSG
jgi:hypothetical protein